MTDEKKEPDEDEVSEEQLQDVAGGATAPKAEMEILSTKQEDMASAPLADFVNDGNILPDVSLDLVTRTDDED